MSEVPESESAPDRGPDFNPRWLFNTPEAQGSEIPLGWKPTPSAPVPVVRCTVIKKDGTRCQRWSLRGMTKCHTHGKRELNLPTVAARRDAILEAARLRLLDDTDVAIDTLEQLLQPGTAEGIRLKASTEILDRAGVRGGFEVDVEVTDKTDPAEVIRERLAKLRDAAGYGKPAELPAITGEDIVDAEEVDGEDPNQSPLFEL